MELFVTSNDQLLMDYLSYRDFCKRDRQKFCHLSVGTERDSDSELDSCPEVDSCSELYSGFELDSSLELDSGFEILDLKDEFLD